MLTNDDLQSIQQVVKKVIDEATEDSDQRTAAGFAEVHEKIEEVRTELKSDIRQLDDRLTVKDGKLENTLARVDRHDIEITKIKKKLSIA